MLHGAWTWEGQNGYPTGYPLVYRTARGYWQKRIHDLCTNKHRLLFSSVPSVTRCGSRRRLQQAGAGSAETCRFGSSCITTARLATWSLISRSRMSGGVTRTTLTRCTSCVTRPTLTNPSGMRPGTKLRSTSQRMQTISGSPSCQPPSPPRDVSMQSSSACCSITLTARARSSSD